MFKLLEASLELLVPLVVADIIDVGIENGDASYVLGRGGILILLGLTGLVSSITAQYFAAKAAVGGCTQMRGALFAHLNRFSYKEAGYNRHLDADHPDHQRYQPGADGREPGAAPLPALALYRVGAMVMAFTIDVKAALIFAGVIPVLFAVVFGINGPSRFRCTERCRDSWTGCCSMCGRISLACGWSGRSTGRRMKERFFMGTALPL